MRGHKYSSTLSLTSVIDGVGCQRHISAPLTPEKRTGTHCTGGKGDSNARSGRMRKDWIQPGFDPRTFPPVEIRYND
jgi:hypothetical protein